MPVKFSDRVMRALKKEPLNIKHLKKLASMEEGSSIIAIATCTNCSVETLRVLIKEGCGDVNGTYKFKNETKTAIEYAFYRNYNLLDALLQAGANFILPDVYEIQFHHVNTIKKLETLLHYFPLQVNILLELVIQDHFLSSKYRKEEKFAIVKYLLKKGTEIYRSRPWYNLNDLDLQEICVKKEKFKECEKLYPLLRKFNSLMKYKKNVEPKIYLLYKVRMLYQAHFVKEHFYKKDPSSIDYLPTPLKNRIDQLPQVKYTVEGVSAYPGGEMEKNGMNPKTILQQEIIYQVANMKIQDIFQELLGYFKM